MEQQAQHPTPERIFNTFNAYQQTAALRGAIDLDLFTAVAEGTDTPRALAQRLRASERGLRILCDFLVVHGFLTKDGERYSLAPDAAVFLNRRSPAYLGSAVNFLNSPMVLESFRDVAAIVRNGGTVLDSKWALAPDDPAWVEFARSMAPLMTAPAEDIAELLDGRSGAEWKVLDIAAGHGTFGIAIAKQNPNAEIVALDWPNVLQVAQENARTAGVDERYRLLPGSAFDLDYGEGYDLVLLTNFLHHFDMAACEEIMGKVHRALKSGGRAVTLEFVPDEDRVSPPIPAAFSLMMLGATPGGDAYTFREYDEAFGRAGFSRNELHPLPRSVQRVILSYK